ncbi:sulfide:quinone oxidoreductase [Roseovarius nanhaiticus]|uniref:Sulfide:quinone oxidoreductase n=1 Tax=Roseovarius nanhaiticus TaxID=573024 RepID=A0A1N7EC59_9RHOB|nr:TIGR01244 family sulfur transferase [Roseovarius nanhaiticus]SEK77731.1 sulfide:quinone oxidoreductase [Roseovarius nanhaiticus]SIR85687.1 sulfide:quinone oxidoreductase [Roseovarius nanhaiticus]
MDLRKITDDFSVSAQIAPADVPAIKEAGFKAIMCNRPDDEDPGQPDIAGIAAAAREAGLEFRAVPIVSGQLTEADVEEFKAALADLPAPVLAYCRSGTRCTTVWSITQVGVTPPDQIVAAAANAGYDVRGIVAQLSDRN